MGYAQEKITPYGNRQAKGEQVEQMFDHIAHSYDDLNHWLSWGIDRRWRRATVDAMKSLPHDELLDVATGTGDFAMLACRRLHPKSILATDFSEGMMAVARKKVKEAGMDHIISFQKEDCLQLSLPDESFDAVTVAYGVRNFQDLDKGLREICRVLRPHGAAVILELCTPRSFPMKQLFWLYSHIVMPLLGRLVSKDPRAYTYLPATMEAFPQGEAMQQILLRAGFKPVEFRRFTFGLSTVYIAHKQV